MNSVLPLREAASDIYYLTRAVKSKEEEQCQKKKVQKENWDGRTGRKTRSVSKNEKEIGRLVDKVTLTDG